MLLPTASTIGQAPPCDGDWIMSTIRKMSFSPFVIKEALLPLSWLVIWDIEPQID
jgi:hypothetical protein